MRVHAVLPEITRNSHRAGFVSKAYNQESKLDTKIGLLWLNDLEDYAQHKHPTQILLDPQSCESNCVHGEIGDYKAWDIETAIGLEGERTLGNFLDEAFVEKIEIFKIKSGRLHRRGRAKAKTNTPVTMQTTTQGSQLSNTTLSSENVTLTPTNSESTGTESPLRLTTKSSTIQTSPDDEFVTISRKKRWVTSDGSDHIDRLILDGVLSDNDLVIYTAIDIQGNYNFIIKIYNNPVLQVLTSANSLTDDEHIDELKHICDTWRYTQTLESNI